MIVSIFKSVKDPNTPFNKSIQYALERIQKGNSKVMVEQLRQMSESDYNKNKAKLPGVCFNGKFKNRSASGLIEHSGIIVLDFDKLNSREDAENLRDSISDDNYVMAAWISPSAKGIKVLVKVPPIPKNHKGYFESLKAHFNHENWDNSGSDVSRFCFESYDADMYINYDSDVWSDIEQPDIEDVGVSEPMIIETSTNIIINNLVVWWTKKYGMTKGSKNTNLFILAKAFFDFGISASEAEQECLKFDEGGKAKEITAIVKSAYKGQNPGTKFFENTTELIKVEKLIREGKPIKEITTMFPNLDIQKFKEQLTVDEYWYYNDKGTIFMSTHKFKFWLEQNNYFKFYPSASSSTFTFIKKEQNLLEITSTQRIKDFVLEDIQTRPNIGYGPFDFIAGNTSFFKQEFLSMLGTTEIKMKEDTITDAFLYYKNCVVNVTAGKIEKIDYIDIDGYVWRDQIINRNFNNSDHHDSEFRKFIWLISGRDVDKYNTFKTVIGYLLHSYKTSANNKAIIFNDGTISDNPNGGSGKGIFWNSLKHMKKVARIDGKAFDPGNSFPYQTVNTDTQILVFDDVKKNFNFENLFSLITEGITLEYKGQDAISVPVEKSPKLIITTNYTVRGSGGSFDRRKFEVEMSSYFNSKNTPMKIFGHMLFSDWNDDEWSKFDNFMIQCLQYYLQNGLMEHEFDNLDVRKFQSETSPDFHEWSLEIGNLPIDVRIDKTDIFNKFVNEYPDYKKWLSQRKFTQWIEKFAEANGYKSYQGRTYDMRYIEITNKTKTETDEQDTSEVPF